MLYSEGRNKGKVHMVMLSASTEEESLFFYVNRHIDRFNEQPRLFSVMSRFMPDIQSTGFKIMTLEAFRRTTPNDYAVPIEEVGVVIELKLMPGVDNPTRACAQLGEALAVIFRMSLWEVLISGRYGHTEPSSCNQLTIYDFPAAYLHNNSLAASSPAVSLS